MLTLVKGEQKKIMRIDCDFVMEASLYKEMEDLAKEAGMIDMGDYIARSMMAYLQAHRG
jgi:hypothetical protein